MSSLLSLPAGPPEGATILYLCFILALGARYRPVIATCTHLDRIAVTELPDPVAGCEECLKTGDPWVHLRMCMTCGKVGCCDSSPNRHASGHARSEDHPIARSAQPGEDWRWCYVDEVALTTPARTG